MITAMVVVIDEGVDLLTEITRQVIVFQQDAVLQGLVPPLDLALGLRVISTSDGPIQALELVCWSSVQF